MARWRGVLAAVLLLAGPAIADDFSGHLVALRAHWAMVRYGGAGKSAQLGEMPALATEATALRDRYPDRAEPLIWHAAILATHARAQGGLGGFAMIRDAKELLERALAIDPEAEHGLGLAMLGSFYWKVPGFPIGFGDKAKARSYLERALALDPQGIDANYLFAEFLVSEGKIAPARVHLKKALAATPRPGDEVAGRGRQRDARALLATLE